MNCAERLLCWVHTWRLCFRGPTEVQLELALPRLAVVNDDPRLLVQVPVHADSLNSLDVEIVRCDLRSKQRQDAVRK